MLLEECLLFGFELLGHSRAVASPQLLRQTFLDFRRCLFVLCYFECSALDFDLHLHGNLVFENFLEQLSKLTNGFIEDWQQLLSLEI